MRVLFINLSVLLIVANSAIADEVKTDKVETDSAEKNLEETPLGELQALDKIENLDDLDGDEVNRKKKSATTTFCVEIRPSGEDQRPFQVCEPATDPSKGGGYPVPGQQGYYQSQTYGGGGQEQLKPHAAPYQSQVAMGGQGKPAAAFTSSVKTYAAPASGAAGKSYPTHTPYGTYRSNDGDDKDGQLLRTSADSDEDEGSPEDLHARSAYDGYSSGYGSPPSYVTGPQKKHHLHSVQHGQNGLVITCQPSLAGYGHPPVVHHGGSVPVPNYSYRSSDGRYGRIYQPYRMQAQQYGGYQHQGSYKPAYQSQSKPGMKPHAPYQQYKPAAYPPPPAAAVYSQPAAPSYPPPTAPAYPPPTAPAYPPPPPPAVYSQQPQQYNAPEFKPQQYPPAPAADYKPEGYTDYKQTPYAPAPVPDYKSQPYSNSPAEYPAAPPAKPQQSNNPSYAPVPSAVYVPPGTYRTAEMMEEKQLSAKGDDKGEKESHTLHKMEEINEQRAAGGPWGAEMATDGAKKDESAMAGGWRHADGGEDENKGFESARENEVDDHNM